MNRLKILAIVETLLLISLLSYVGISAMTYTSHIGSTGNVKSVNVQVYSDSGLSQLLSSIDWGFIEPGQTVSFNNCYVRNNGNVPVTLNLTSANWVPTTAAAYLSLSWTVEGHVLNAGDSIQAPISLSASNTAVQGQGFSFNIVITGLTS